MALKLNLYNPTPDRARVDYVVTPWFPISERTGIRPEELVVRDSAGDVLASQVDLIDPEDPRRAVLVFDLRRPVDPGDENYTRATDHVTVERGDAAPQGPSTLHTHVDGEPGRETGFKLLNERLDVWFYLVPEPWDDGRGWFAGAATSVLLDGREALDAFVESWLGHDPEKRCMQLDFITLSRPPWEPEQTQRVNFHDRRYRVVPGTVARGPVRAGVTIASEPFDYEFADPLTGERRRLTCELFRTISLPRRVNFVKEDLFIKARLAGATEPWPAPLYFTAHYFTYIQMGMEPGTSYDIFHLPTVPDWFAISSYWNPYQGYGFATNAHASRVSNPHPDFPADLEEGARKTFSWWTLPHHDVSALHLFWFSQPDENNKRPKSPQSQAGHAWYEFVFKPLAARIA